MLEKKEKDIGTCSEAALYFIIESFGGFLWRLRHDSADGRIPIDHKSEQELQQRIDAAVDQTTRFGVSTPRTDKGATEEYMRWYRWWNSWHHAMSDEDWRKVDDQMLNDPEYLGKLQPPGSWK